MQFREGPVPTSKGRTRLVGKAAPTKWRSHHDHLPGRDLHGLALVAPQPQDGRAARHAQHLVNHGVIVDEVVDAIAPPAAPGRLSTTTGLPRLLASSGI